ncbi:MAG: hypothetical protein HKO79_01385 [Desulfobacterales bacterium]|nr:hypothetical protein [Deltaproteobacteria bacterium]NNK86133.1 hypothetical protein [Desulfobacterales bacterium]NNL41127.1 hypothetical protein [Desulfobacterales bacterium]
MEESKVSIFRQYPFHEGQKINIDGGPRKGDWEVIGVTDHKVTFRCPISFKEFKWDRFCYFVEDVSGVNWPDID